MFILGEGQETFACLAFLLQDFQGQFRIGLCSLCVVWEGSTYPPGGHFAIHGQSLLFPVWSKPSATQPTSNLGFILEKVFVSQVSDVHEQPVPDNFYQLTGQEIEYLSTRGPAQFKFTVCSSSSSVVYLFFSLQLFPFLLMFLIY